MVFSIVLGDLGAGVGVLVMSPSGRLSSRREASMAAMVARVHVRTGLVRAIRGEAGRACGR